MKEIIVRDKIGRLENPNEKEIHTNDGVVTINRHWKEFEDANLGHHIDAPDGRCFVEDELVWEFKTPQGEWVEIHKNFITNELAERLVTDDFDTRPVWKLAQEKAEPKCVMGCKHFTGSEIKHDKNCPFYPGISSRVIG